jgi:hypothetical protein
MLTNRIVYYQYDFVFNFFNQYSIYIKKHHGSPIYNKIQK